MTQAMYEAECAWVPGTTDRVRFRLARRGQSREQVRELTLSRLVAVLGRSLIADMYLKGRARLRLSDRQLSELTF